MYIYIHSLTSHKKSLCWTGSGPTCVSRGSTINIYIYVCMYVMLCCVVLCYVLLCYVMYVCIYIYIIYIYYIYIHIYTYTHIHWNKWLGMYLPKKDRKSIYHDIRSILLFYLIADCYNLGELMWCNEMQWDIMGCNGI